MAEDREDPCELGTGYQLPVSPKVRKGSFGESFGPVTGKNGDHTILNSESIRN